MEELEKRPWYDMKLEEFRTITVEDRHDSYFSYVKAWSRLYEYPMVMDMIDKYCGNFGELSVHNTCWGWEGVHIVFKEYLESRFASVVNTDRNRSNHKNTDVWDISHPCPEEYKEKFDVVLNISTLEEVPAAIQEKCFFNMMDQVKTGGFLICTFDIPGLNIPLFENMFDSGEMFDASKHPHLYEPLSPPENLNGANSVLPNPRYKHLNCGIMVIRKL